MAISTPVQKNHEKQAMYISASTLDDLLMRVFQKLLGADNQVKASRGDTKELVGVLLKIRDPRARLSRTETRGKMFSCLGELLWYLSGRNDLEFITHYIPEYKINSDDNKTIHGGYGPRLFNMRGKVNQFANILNLLKKYPSSRRVVIQLFDADDIANGHLKDIPCTCTLQFMIRKSKLHMFTSMRSNDAFLGLPHDIFAFTMLQEYIARIIGIELGAYKHAVGSLHLYDRNFVAAQQYLDEGWQERISMPAMPIGDPRNAMKTVLACEEAIRTGKQITIKNLKIDDYWADLVRLLQIHWHAKKKNMRAITRIEKQMSSPIFNTYIRNKQKPTAKKTPEQLRFPVTQ